MHKPATPCRAKEKPIPFLLNYLNRGYMQITSGTGYYIVLMSNQKKKK